MRRPPGACFDAGRVGTALPGLDEFGQGLEVAHATRAVAVEPVGPVSTLGALVLAQREAHQESLHHALVAGHRQVEGAFLEGRAVVDGLVAAGADPGAGELGERILEQGPVDGMVVACTRNEPRLGQRPMTSVVKDTVALRSDTMTRQLTAIIEREGDGYVALCPELDIASQGDSVCERGRICAKLWSCFSKRPLPARFKKDSMAKSM